MDTPDFLSNAGHLINCTTEYLETLKRRKLMPSVAPGDVVKSLPSEMPIESESFMKIMDDVNMKLMPGVVHWSHPRFFGYLPSSHGFPSLLADMLVGKLGIMAFSWVAGPAVTELELAMSDWVARSFGLPETFINGVKMSSGGGVFASSATEAVVMAMVAARQKAIASLKTEEGHDAKVAATLVAYCSADAHSSTKKAARIASVKLRVIELDDDFTFSPKALLNAMQEDAKNGLHPCFLNLTFGTYSTGSFDDIQALAPIAQNYPHCWIHVNGAYGGNNFICPELRKPLKGINMANSFCVNLCKGLLVSADLTCMWVKNKLDFCSGLVVDPLYLQHKFTDQYYDLRNWSLFLSRRFRALKVWYTYRVYGVEGLQAHMRQMHRMAKLFQELPERDPRFEVCNSVETPLVCFRLKDSNETNHLLLAAINKTNRILLTPAYVNDKFMLRFSVGNEGTNKTDIEFAWQVIIKAVESLDELKLLETENDSYVRRLSYTQRVSYSDYQRYNPRITLKDSETPVYLPFHEEEEEEFA